jgi:hypothetical protein
VPKAPRLRPAAAEVQLMGQAKQGGSRDERIAQAALKARTTGSPSEHDGPRQVMTSLYRGLAFCEMHVPAAAAGMFIPVGNSFDAFSALTKIFHTAVSGVMIVDPYMDAIALADFGVLVPESVPLRVLTDASYKQTLSQPQKMGRAIWTRTTARDQNFAAYVVA